MSYLKKNNPDIKIGIIVLDINGVTISNTQPVVTLSTLNWITNDQGSASLSGNTITLSPNKKYILQATLSSSGTSPYSADRKYRWKDITNNQWLGKHGAIMTSYEAYAGVETTRIDESARCIKICNESSVNIQLHYSGTTVQSFDVGQRITSGVYNYLTDYGRLEIWEF